jgi:hypothetical protein
MKKKGNQMKRKAFKFDGEISVGDVVKIPVSEFDVSKADVKNLICVVVERSIHGQFQLATSKGVFLNTMYARHRVSLCHGVSRELVQLEDAYNRWRGMAKYSE